MWILRDLLNEDVVRHDVLYEWLGRRYAETSDFLASRKYFKMARDIRQGIAVDVTKVCVFSGPYPHAATGPPSQRHLVCVLRWCRRRVTRCSRPTPTRSSAWRSTARSRPSASTTGGGAAPAAGRRASTWACSGTTSPWNGTRRRPAWTWRRTSLGSTRSRRTPGTPPPTRCAWVGRRSLPSFFHASRPTPPPRSLRPGGGHPPRRGAARLLHAAEGAPGRRHRALRRAHARVVRAPGRLNATREERRGVFKKLRTW